MNLTTNFNTKYAKDEKSNRLTSGSDENVDVTNNFVDFDDTEAVHATNITKNKKTSRQRVLEST